MFLITCWCSRFLTVLFWFFLILHTVLLNGNLFAHGPIEQKYSLHTVLLNENLFAHGPNEQKYFLRTVLLNGNLFAHGPIK